MLARYEVRPVASFLGFAINNSQERTEISRIPTRRICHCKFVIINHLAMNCPASPSQMMKENKID